MAASSTPIVRRFRWSTLRPAKISYEFRKDSQSLLLTFSRNANHRICICFHAKQLDDLLDVFELFLSTYFCGLSKHGTETQSLPNSGSGKMQILLLDISGFPLERLVALAAVDKHFTRHHTHSNTRS